MLLLENRNDWLSGDVIKLIFQVYVKGAEREKG